MQMGCTADTFHFLLIMSYSRDASEVTAGQARPGSYTSKQINIPRPEERLELEASSGLMERLGGRGGERSRILELDFGAHSTREQNSGTLSGWQK